MSANRLLAALPEDVRASLSGTIHKTHLKLGDVLFEARDRLRYVYFPVDSIVSLTYVMENGACAEISIVGNDGMLGTSAFMSGYNTLGRAVVQSPGKAWRLPAERLAEVFHDNDAARRILMLYMQILVTQVAQTAACNRHHTIDRQLARWLLMSLDRLPVNHLEMTQDLIANMLGVRREGVTAAAVKLQRRGLIRYTRGHIELVDRDGLEAYACECYAAVKRETDWLMAALESAPPAGPGSSA